MPGILDISTLGKGNLPGERAQIDSDLAYMLGYPQGNFMSQAAGDAGWYGADPKTILSAMLGLGQQQQATADTNMRGNIAAMGAESHMYAADQQRAAHEAAIAQKASEGAANRQNILDRTGMVMKQKSAHEARMSQDNFKKMLVAMQLQAMKSGQKHWDVFKELDPTSKMRVMQGFFDMTKGEGQKGKEDPVRALLGFSNFMRQLDQQNQPDYSNLPFTDMLGIGGE